MTSTTNYLGKEQISSLLFLRFGSMVFDCMWNHDWNHCIIITLHEQKYCSNSNKSKKSSSSTDNSNKKSKAQHADACVAMK